MNKRTVRITLAAAVFAATIVLFVRYFVSHPNYWHQLGSMSPWTVVWVLLLNALMLGVLVMITDVTVRLCGQRIGRRENLLLTAYSSVANFFGPLQSGPGVRAVYLRSKHHVRLRDYTLASLIALGMFACYSALFLFVGTRPWWQTLGALLIAVGVSALVLRVFMRRDKHPTESQFSLRPRLLAALLVLTFLQACITVAWYYVELRAVNSNVQFGQAMSYAGAANFSLFVSITPDGVGIREAFLVFSQHIHHVSTANIVSANVIDRASYVLFLGIVFVAALGTHAKDKLRPTKASPQAAAGDEPAPR